MTRVQDLKAELARRFPDAVRRWEKAVEIEQHFAREAKERQREHGKTAPGRKKTLVGDCPTSVTRKSRDQAASAVGISGKLLQKAKTLARKVVAARRKPL